MAGLRCGMEWVGSAGGLAWWMIYFHFDVRMISIGLDILVIFCRLFNSVSRFPAGVYRPYIPGRHRIMRWYYDRRKAFVLTQTLTRRLGSLNPYSALVIAAYIIVCTIKYVGYNPMYTFRLCLSTLSVRPERCVCDNTSVTLHTRLRIQHHTTSRSTSNFKTKCSKVL